MVGSDDKVGGLYLIQLSDTHYYGGRTRNFKARWRTHLRDLRSGRHPNVYMPRVFDQHRRFKPQIVHVVADMAGQLAVEQRWLDTQFGEPGCVNLSPTSETRARMVESARQREARKKAQAPGSAPR